MATALRIAARYIGPSAGAAYTEGSAEDVIIRLEPTELRSWDFSDEYAAPGPS